MEKKTEVAIGILCDDAGRLLVGRRMRPPQAGKWEMPGGKVELGETVLNALRREFFEEGGVVLDAIAHWTQIEDDAFILYLFKVHTRDEFIPTIYEEYRFVTMEELVDLDWIESNRSFVTDLRDILKTHPVVEEISYLPQSPDDLERCLDAFALSLKSRDRFTRVSCIIEEDALLFPDDDQLNEKVDRMYHQGLTFYAPIKRPRVLPVYVLPKERG
ncbi:MAG: NUDIX domain-containing protein [Erysipelotrichaceae bacterium]